MLRKLIGIYGIDRMVFSGDSAAVAKLFYLIFSPVFCDI